MADAPIPTPDFVDVSDGAQKAAAAALDSNAPFVVPENAEKQVSKKNGDEYYRWMEAGVVEAAWREGDANDPNKITAVVQLKVRAGFPNEHKRIWARHTLNIRLLLGNGTADDNTQKEQFKHNLGVNGLTQLFNATGFAPKSAGLKASLLNAMFPPKGQPGASAPTVGKSVMMNLGDAPNKGEKAKHDRRTNVEGYLPDVPTA